jgi:hypothetical protein
MKVGELLRQQEAIMRNTFMLALGILAVMMCSSGFCLECPESPKQVSKDWEVAVNAAVAKIGPVHGGDLQVQTKNATQDLLGKLPNADRLYLEQMMFAAFCSALRDDKTISEAEKAQRLRAYITEVRRTIAQQPAKPTGGAKPKNESQTTKPSKIDHNTARYGVSLGWDLGRYEFLRDSPFPEAQQAVPALESDILSLLTADGFPNPSLGPSAPELIHTVLLYYGAKDIRKHASILVGIAAMRASLVGASSDATHNDELKQLVLSTLQDIDSSVIADKEKAYLQLVDKKPSTVAGVVDLLDKMQ